MDNSAVTKRIWVYPYSRVRFICIVYHPQVNYMYIMVCLINYRNNSLSVLPDEMESLQNLHTLTLSFNRSVLVVFIVQM